MKTLDVAKLEPFDRFLYWIKERESTRKLKTEGKPKPWTDDEILLKYRFCNVRRMDDVVSQWLLKNWYQPNFNHPNMLFAVVLARFLNLPSSLECVGFPLRWSKERIKRIKDLLRTKKQGGETIFNSAYMVRGNDGEDKLASVIDYIIQPLIANPPTLDTGSMQRCWVSIECRYGFGSFMAGQVVADLRWALSGTWNDRREWAPAGPGSQRGLNRLLGRPVKQPIKQDQFLEELQALIQECKTQIPLGLSRKMEAIDWQNCCCEYDKYCRTLNNEGRPKRLYPGGSV